MHPRIEELSRPPLVHNRAVGRQRDEHARAASGILDHLVTTRMNKRFTFTRVAYVLRKPAAVLAHLVHHSFIQSRIEMRAGIVRRFLECRMRTMDAREIANLRGVNDDLGWKI